MAMMLAQRSGSCGADVANATVTIAHSRTANLADVCRSADVLIAAVGVPEMITGDMVQEGAIVIDVGINRVDGKLVGDVAFEAAKVKASAITPVPGGVGPLTIAMLLHNTVMAAKASKTHWFLKHEFLTRRLRQNTIPKRKRVNAPRSVSTSNFTREDKFGRNLTL